MNLLRKLARVLGFSPRNKPEATPTPNPRLEFLVEVLQATAKDDSPESIIIDGKIWIQRDGIEDGITDELVATGVPKDKIVLAFHSPDVRQHTG